MSDNATEFIREWCEFGEFRSYILLIIARRKFNDSLTHNTEIVHRRVLTKPEDVARCYRDLRGLTDRYENHFRLYLTVNARDTLTGYFNFRQEMNSWVQDHLNGDVNAEDKFGKVDSYWKSAIHRPEAKTDSYFLFDVDGVTTEEVVSFQESLPRQDGRSVWVMTRKTPNGYHVITNPFNYTEWEPAVEYDDLDTDGQVFVEEIKP